MFDDNNEPLSGRVISVLAILAMIALVALIVAGFITGGE